MSKRGGEGKGARSIVLFAIYKWEPRNMISITAPHWKPLRCASVSKAPIGSAQIESAAPSSNPIAIILIILMNIFIATTITIGIRLLVRITTIVAKARIIAFFCNYGFYICF